MFVLMLIIKIFFIQASSVMPVIDFTLNFSSCKSSLMTLVNTITQISLCCFDILSFFLLFLFFIYFMDRCLAPFICLTMIENKETLYFYIVLDPRESEKKSIVMLMIVSG